MLYLDHSQIADDVLVDFDIGISALYEGVTELRQTVLQPPAATDPVSWIKKNIELPKSKTEKQGDLVLTGYQREFVRLYFDENTTEIVVTKGTRVGMSLLLSAMAAYILCYLGESVTIAQPTEGDAEEYYKERIEPLFEMCPALGALRRKPRRGERQDTWNLIELSNGAVLRLVGAASDDNFRRYGSKHNWGDEYSADGWSPTSKTQGEKADLFMERGGEFTNPKLVLISSPLGKDNCRTTARHADSDQQEPHACCPHCEHPQIFEWGDRDTPYGFKLIRDAEGFVEKVFYECIACHEPIYEHTQFPEPKTVNGKVCLSHKDYLDATLHYKPSVAWKKKGRRGMYIPQWFSPNGRATWKVIGDQFLAKRGNPEEMKTWVNNAKGVAYDDFTTSSMEASFVQDMLKSYPAAVPDDVVLLTLSGDTQTNKEGGHLERIASRECTVLGWNRFSQFRVIGHWVIEGEPGDAAADAAVRALIDRKFKKRDGTELGIIASVFEMGGDFPDEVRAFCATFPLRRNVWAIKGNNNSKGSRRATVWPKKVSRNTKSGALHYTIDSQLARDAVFRLLQMRGDQSPTIPLSMPADYLEKLLCEERKKINGGYYWKPKQGHRTEEEWINLAYGYAALKGLQASYKSWRDLNLAARTLGIPETSHDPVTGEIDYYGPDLSAHAIERIGSGMEIAVVAATVPLPRTNRKVSAQAEERKAAPTPAPVAQPPKQQTVKVKKTLKQFKSNWGRQW
ncbi:terminase gpA endonuclease subunit [Agrobacterium sp. 22094]|uniref:terminase gpA endonuclease subunit n=1 Tax=Agrobacterium sp. 22094 TaxID=3453872 RepID=UPI003F83CF9C